MRRTKQPDLRKWKDYRINVIEDAIGSVYNRNLDEEEISMKTKKVDGNMKTVKRIKKMKEQTLRKLIREQFRSLIHRNKSSKLKDLMPEGIGGMSFISTTPALQGTSPFSARRKDNFTFKGLPGRVGTKKLTEDNHKILAEIITKLDSVVKSTGNLYLDEALSLIKRAR